VIICVGAKKTASSTKAEKRENENIKYGLKK
jgi:hypothetical protein